MERLFIVNPWSGEGKGLRCIKFIEYWYAKIGIKPIIWFTTEDGPNTDFNLGTKAVREGFGLVCVVGGEGTGNSVVSGIIASGASSEQFPILGFVQGGTSNNFAKNVGIPKNLVRALKVIENGKVARIDVGKLTTRNEERYFLNTFSCGNDARIAKLAEESKEGFPPKKSRYLSAILGELVKGVEPYWIGINGQAPKEMTLVAVANGPTYGDIFHIAPGADLQDGLLDVCCIGYVGKTRALEVITRVMQGTHVSMSEVAMFKISSLTISSPENLPGQTDGEVLATEKECKIEVLPGILKVLAQSVVLRAQTPLCVQAPEFQSA